MIQDDIINELKYIPEANLTELYNLIHSFRLKFNQHDDDLKIDEQACLAAFEKIKQGDKSGLTEIGDIDEYIENLKYEINQD
jgi:hypothetical protein